LPVPTMSRERKLRPAMMRGSVKEALREWDWEF